MLLGDFEGWGWLGAVKDGGLDDFELLAGQGDFALDDFGMFAPLKPFADGLGDHVLGWQVVFSGGIEELVKFINWQFNDCLPQNLICCPLRNSGR